MLIAPWVPWKLLLSLPLISLAVVSRSALCMRVWVVCESILSLTWWVALLTAFIWSRRLSIAVPKKPYPCYFAKASNESGMGKMAKNGYFRPISSHISETTEDRHNGRLTGRICDFDFYYGMACIGVLFFWWRRCGRSLYCCCPLCICLCLTL